MSARPSLPPSIAVRLAGLDWPALDAELDERGYARTPPLLTGEECGALVGLYGEERRFRSRIDMARYRFGVGEYQYFASPLPGPVAALRAHAYPHLAAIANRWASALGAPGRYPADLAAFLRICADHGQTKPTPLLLRYKVGGYNCLHQDLYGAVAFPLQMTWALSRRGVDLAARACSWSSGPARSRAARSSRSSGARRSSSRRIIARCGAPAGIIA